MTTQTINLNMISGGVLPVVYASQYDNQVDALIFNLYDGTSVFEIPVGASVLINGTKPPVDGGTPTGFSYSAASFSGNQVVCNVTQQMTAVIGDIICELRVRTLSEIVGSINFVLRVEPSALNDDTVLSETEIPLIEQAIDIAANLAGYIETAVDAADSASASAQAAQDSAYAAAIDAANVDAQYSALEQLKSDTSGAKDAAQAAADAISNISATATTLSPGSSATASYNTSTQVLTLGIPTGATGASGVTTPLAGFFTMWVDPDTGNLYAASETDMSDYFYYDSTTGNLYFLTEDGN